MSDDYQPTLTPIDPTAPLADRLMAVSGEAALALDLWEKQLADARADLAALRSELSAVRESLAHAIAAVGRPPDDTPLVRAARAGVILALADEHASAAWLRAAGWIQVISGWRSGDSGIYPFQAAVLTQARFDATPLRHLIG